jgi:hypothetical protein
MSQFLIEVHRCTGEGKHYLGFGGCNGGASEGLLGYSLKQEKAPTSNVQTIYSGMTSSGARHSTIGALNGYQPVGWIPTGTSLNWGDLKP